MEFEAAVGALRAAVRDVPDFPKPGILFKDITTLLKDRVLLRLSIDLLSGLLGARKIDTIVAVESRGFILGSILADRLGAGFVPVRKPGKLPSKTRRASYDLEYGQDSVEIHEDAIARGERVLIVDDVIATGGTAQATGELVRALGGNIVAYLFLVELEFQKGRSKLGGEEVLSLLRY
jgi:adenine phosphoribosyltransferase